MNDLPNPTLSLAAGYHLRARPLWDGRVGMSNFVLTVTAFEDDARRHDEFLAGRFNAGEFSLANYLALKSRGEPLMAIPVFPNRKFRHSYIFVPDDSPVEEPAQLKSRRVGIPSWLNTAGLWVRGILSDDYGVDFRDIRWIARRKPPLDLALPPGTRLETMSAEGSLTSCLLKGDLDAIIVPDYPEERGIRRLFADSKTVEQSYYRRTQIFPTSHAITFHRSFLDRYPPAAQELFSAFCQAKRLALHDDADATYSNFAWNRQSWEEQLAILGADPWRYGLRGNETVLQTLIRYAAEQGILANRATLEDLFVCIDEP